MSTFPHRHLLGTERLTADELGTMASKSDGSGPLTDLAHRGARTGGELSIGMAQQLDDDDLRAVAPPTRVEVR